MTDHPEDLSSSSNTNIQILDSAGRHQNISDSHLAVNLYSSFLIKGSVFSSLYTIEGFTKYGTLYFLRPFHFYLFDEWVLKSVLLWRIFFLPFFWTMGKIQGYLIPNIGVPTPNFRGTYPQNSRTKKRKLFQIWGGEKISLHFWMIKIMFKNIKKEGNGAQIRENSLSFFF